ncbi:MULTISPECIES: CDP-diacylglycerol--serine O-phosphatidyltransferase [unclassified Duganella]|uniref:CDP-diacylglycerol--serine O-phosphatidyltransferase n=1 Tax=unclassified Duganella TaxID=2636909 RepID=UPI000886D30E|nr:MULTISPECIES: CDP-diacylglycerol--serine O-phosphatidyltransferase [unclassified Duganella]SDH48213.1 CDP-diacylglycerol---serine O-phosphatidyltransferase [Duganella sp. OV458]SDK64855.1 CDP-diacylglycerol---serine O-phosphatidyltransferase [Duganella sp. OV510]
MQRAKFALPSIVTLMSIACGFGSIVISVDNAVDGLAADYRLAAVLLVLAGVFDALDGFVARATNTQSEFGMQLDSIADVMNFGCAPGLLLYCWGFQKLGLDYPTLLRLGGMASFFFVACGALRLARFNVNVGRTDPRYFVGMPITAGAACVASVVVAWPEPAASVLNGSLIVLLLFVVGTLMVSTVRFPSSKQKKSWAALVLLLVNLGLLAWLQMAYFVLFFLVYIIGTLALNAAWKTGWQGIAPPVIYGDDD